MRIVSSGLNPILTTCLIHPSSSFVRRVHRPEPVLKVVDPELDGLTTRDRSQMRGDRKSEAMRLVDDRRQSVLRDELVQRKQSVRLSVGHLRNE